MQTCSWVIKSLISCVDNQRKFTNFRRSITRSYIIGSTRPPPPFYPLKIPLRSARSPTLRNNPMTSSVGRRFWRESLKAKKVCLKDKVKASVMEPVRREILKDREKASVMGSVSRQRLWMKNSLWVYPLRETKWLLLVSFMVDNLWYRMFVDVFFGLYGYLEEL